MKRAFLALALLFSPFLANGEVLTGLDVLQKDDFKQLRGKTVAVITNHTGKDSKGRGIVDILAKAPKVKLKAIFTPEHGFRGAEPAGAIISSSTDPATGLPIYSLYGAAKRPQPETLAGVDALIFDMQDVGARFYTYLTTMVMAMEVAGQNRIEFVVLDRPNPLGGAIIEGPVKMPEISYFTAYLPTPIRHGLTPGEAATLYNATLEQPAKLTVVRMEGWKRSMFWADTGLEWTNPSPNIRTAEAALLYPGIGCFESTNVSVGRGTETPFEWFGAPWLDAYGLSRHLKKLKLPGISIREKARTPKDDRYKGQDCRGIQVKVTDPAAARPVELWIHIMAFLRERHSYEFDPRWDEVRRMVGNDDFQKRYLGQESPEAMIAALRQSSAGFEKSRQPYLLYK